MVLEIYKLTQRWCGEAIDNGFCREEAVVSNDFVEVGGIVLEINQG